MVRCWVVVIVTALAAVSCGSDGSSSDPDATAAGAALDREPDPAAQADHSEPEDVESPDPTSVDPVAESISSDSSSETDTRSTPVWAPTELGTDQNAAAWAVQILDIRPHDPSAFTQGFEVHDGALYESTGRFGESTVRTVDIDSGEVTASVETDPNEWAEGLTISGDRIIQLTWQSGVAYARDLRSFEPLAEFSYDGEGWGLCNDGSRLVMSNGSSELAFRDAATFDIVGTVDVHMNGDPVPSLNELECVDGYVLANVRTTSVIVVIDPDDGRVAATIDASELTLDATGTLEQDPLLNGIAHLAGDMFLLTGKLWPSMYLIRFVSA